MEPPAGHKEPAPVEPPAGPKEPAPVKPPVDPPAAPSEPAPVNPVEPVVAPVGPNDPAPVEPEPPVEDWWLRWCSQCGENAYWREGACLNPACKVTRQIGLKMKEV